MSYDLSAIRRYTLASYTRAQFVNQMGNLLANDPFWTVTSLTTTNGVTGATHGVIKLTNKADTNMEFLIGMDWSTNSGAALRFGLKKQGATPSLDCYTESGKSGQYDMALQLQNPNRYLDANALSRMDVITQKECIFVMTTPITYIDSDVPVRLYLGRCKPFEVEDNSYGSEFYGVFGHIPLGVSNAASLEFANATGYVVSRGVVKKNRSNQLYGEYDFVGSSQVLSPGPGGRIIMSPFLLGNAQEGVRGTFWDVNTAVLRSTQFFPDGSVIDIDGARYYVLHCDINATSWWPQSATATHSVVQYGYNFFDSVAVPFGTRVMLFKI